MGCILARYVLAMLGSFAIAISYIFRVNLSIAMVRMVNNTAIQAHNDKNEDGPFIWSESLQGTILSSYFWGYIVFQVPGGRIAEVFSAKWVMFFSAAINIVCSILSPLLAKLHYSGLIAMRIGQGLGGAVIFPAMHVILAHWAPPAERGVISSIVYAGMCLGTVVSILLAGLIAGTLGWEAVFYIMGFGCVPWLIAWCWFVQDTPAQQRYISEEERNFITNSLGQIDSKTPEKVLKVPWKSVFTSPPFWAILVAHVCNNWGWYMILIELPFYMTQVLKFNIKENAVLSSIPYLFMWIFSMIISNVLDSLRARETISNTAARKIATGIASVIPASILFAICFVGPRWLAVVMMNIAVTSKGGVFCGFLSNHISIAPNFAGTLIGITNTLATIPGIVVPIFVGYLTHGNQTIGAWSIIFFVTVGIYAVEIIVYFIFASGEEQAWNKPV